MIPVIVAIYVCLGGIFFIYLIKDVLGERLVIGQSSVDRLGQVTLEALVGIFTHFCALLLHVLVHCLALAVRQDVHGVWNLALLDDYLAILDFAHFDIRRHDCE